MKSMIVSSAEPITLLGGARFAQAQLFQALGVAPELVCADGGADAAFEYGLKPRAVMGDLDSISPAAREGFEHVLHLITEQDSTDLQKCLRNISAPFVIGLGFLGDRFDHSLAALFALTEATIPVVLISAQDVLFISPKHLSLDLEPGTRMSLMPVGRPVVSSTGLRWELKDKRMALDQFIGSSNETIARKVEIETSAALAVILPLHCLHASLAGLLAAHGGSYKAPRQ